MDQFKQKLCIILESNKGCVLFEISIATGTKVGVTLLHVSPKIDCFF